MLSSAKNMATSARHDFGDIFSESEMVWRFECLVIDFFDGIPLALSQRIF